MSKGTTVATLFLTQVSEASLYLPSMSMSNVMNRPTFPLHPSSSEIDYTFPQIDNFDAGSNPPGLGISAPAESSFAWMLDFTHGSKRRGVIMNQSRMKAIELVVNPLRGATGLNAVSDVLSLGSWIDLLVRHLDMPE